VKIGVLASHEGTTLQAVLDACASGSLPARVVLVISNNSGSGALRRAALAGVPSLHLSGAAYPDPAELDGAIRDALVAARVDLVFLAGYMKRLGPKVLAAFAGKILNTHPALLPKFGGEGMYGMNVHRAVLAAGEGESGPSVHLVDGDYDTGAVLAQRRVPVEPGDTPETLAARVQECERALVVDVFRELATGARALPIAGGLRSSPTS
jgi:phosphoribosylglycinamide formyltransferase 1